MDLLARRLPANPHDQEVDHETRHAGARGQDRRGERHPRRGLEHRGDPATIGDSIRRFIAWRKAAGLVPRSSATLNILYDDPDGTPPEQFRLDLCAATDRAVQPNDAGIVGKTIPGGRCAMLRHIGTEESFAEAALYLYAQWLPNSGEELRDFPLYCQRISFFPDVPEHEAVTDLFLPLK
jgi:AraC family transcriptional regulator